MKSLEILAVGLINFFCYGVITLPTARDTTFVWYSQWYAIRFWRYHMDLGDMWEQVDNGDSTSYFRHGSGRLGYHLFL